MIHEAQREYEKLHDIGKKHGGAKVELWVVSATPMYSLYRFDKTAILALGSYEEIKGDVSHFIAVKDGSIYRFVVEEFKALIGQGGRTISRKIL